MGETVDRVLVAMDAGERGDFLPGPQWSALKACAADLRIVDTETLDSAGLHRVLAEFRPRVLVTCWSTPPLLASAARDVRSHLDYLCHITGSVRKLVPRRFIELGVTVTNWGGTVGPSVAEAALTLVLCCLRQSTRWAIELHTEGGWRRSRYEQNLGLYGRRLGIHGFGSVARALLPLVAPFGVHVRAFSPGVPDDVYRRHGVQPAEDLRTLFAQSDIVVDAEAVRPETTGTVTEEVLRLLPMDGVFVNVGRGAVVDEAALSTVAIEGWLRVGLDVYRTEPLPPDSPLRGLRNVTLFPHIGGPTRDRRKDCGAHAVRNIRRFAAGEDLSDRVTIDRYDRMT